MSLATARAAVTQALRPAGTTWAALPTPLTLPAIVLTEADPYVEPSGNYGEFDLNFDALLMVRPGKPDVMVDQLDKLAQAAIAAVDDKFVWSLGAYFTTTSPDGQPVLMARLTITTTERLLS